MCVDDIAQGMTMRSLNDARKICTTGGMMTVKDAQS
jgi:hypothetical protein